MIRYKSINSFRRSPPHKKSRVYLLRYTLPCGAYFFSGRAIVSRIDVSAMMFFIL